MSNKSPPELSDIQIKILINLIKGAHIGKRHTPSRSAIKGIPSHDLKLAKHALKELIKKRYINPKVTGHDPDVSINPKFYKEIINVPQIKEAISTEI